MTLIMRKKLAKLRKKRALEEQTRMEEEKAKIRKYSSDR